jgi:hypothetical protein
VRLKLDSVSRDETRKSHQLCWLLHVDQKHARIGLSKRRVTLELVHLMRDRKSTLFAGDFVAVAIEFPRVDFGLSGSFR